MQATALEGGFANAPIDAAHAFRAVMTAMARPGTIHTVTGAVPPAPLSVAAGVILLTLCDPETPVFLAPSHDRPEVREWIGFHTGAPIVGAAQAAFALGRWDDLPLAHFPLGTAEYPDRSATVIVDGRALGDDGAILTGPGIETETRFSLPETAAFQANRQLFPRGLDFLFTDGDRLAGLPRSTRVG